MSHHVIIVTSWDPDALALAYAHALKIFSLGQVSSITSSNANGYGSFFIGPDGSLESWGASDQGDMKRSEMIEWLDGERHGDGSSPYDWAEVNYGREKDGGAEVTMHSGKRCMCTFEDPYRACPFHGHGEATS